MTAAEATHPFDWTLGDRIRKARRVAGLSHAELAASLTERGFPSTAGRVGAWETGKQPRQLERILAEVSEITGAPLDWLLGLSPESGRGTGSFGTPLGLEIVPIGDLPAQLPLPFEARPSLAGV